MKIIQLQAENVKGLKAVTITPEGNSVVLGGNNGAGKSSVLDAIEAALGGRKRAPSGTVRNGEKEARIILETEDLVVTRVITSTKNQVRVEPKDSAGAKMSSPQAVLDKLLGSLTFDPLDFERADPKTQGETLRRMVGLDFREHDANRQGYYDRRTDVNRERKKVQARLDGMPGPHEDVPDSEQGAAELIEEIQEAQAYNRQREALDAKHKERLDTIISAQIEVVRLRDKADRIEHGIHEEQARAAEAKAELDAFASKDVRPLKDNLSNIEDTNRKVRENRTRAETEAEAKKLAAKSKEISTLIDEYDAKKATAIAKADYPVDGLEARDDGVYLDGVPFARASQAERLKACVAIGMALNPELRVLLIRDGCRLDDEGLALLQEMADFEDVQVWIERVGKGDECTIIIEDGEVVAEEVTS